jgi:hypothetical protein
VERSRREFLSQSLAVAGAAGIVVTAPRLLRAQNLNSRVQLACIGVGGRGYGNLREVMKEGNAVPADVVALCDVDTRGLERAAGHCPQARTYRDFRRLYEEAPDIDGVVVSTCEHTHAFATLPAVEVTTDCDFVEAEVAAAEILPWGVRVECRLSEPAEEPLEIPVAIRAVRPA